MNRSLRSLQALLPPMICALLWLMPATAVKADTVSCTITVAPNINLGTYDSANGSSGSAPVGWSCSNTSNQTAYVTLCINIVAGSGGTQGNSRLLSDGAGHTLQFQLYKTAASDPGQIWGSPQTPSWTRLQTTVPPLAKNGGTTLANSGATVYGTAPAGQTANVVAGTYQSTFTNGDALVYSYNLSGGGNQVWPADCGSGNSSNASMTFTVTANVVPACSVSATTLDFGSLTGFMTTNVDATSTVQATCPPGIPYQIGLTNGLYDSGTTRRMAGGSSEFVTYELYRDSNRSQRWGNTQNSDTVTSTGNGASQSTIVYGRVAPQATPSPSIYTDTITVNVFY